MSKMLKTALILLLIGAILVGIAFAMGYDLLNFGIGDSYYKHTMKEMKIENLKELDIDVTFVDLEIVESESGNSLLVYPEFEDEKIKLDIKNDAEKLTITQDYRGLNLNVGIKRLPNMGIKRLPTVKLELAKGTELDKMSIKSDMGTTKTSKIIAKSGKVELNMGQYKSSHDDLTDFTIETDMGESTFDSTKLTNVDASSNMGSVNGSIIPDGNLKFSADMGSVEIDILEGVKYSYLVDSNMGEVSVNGREIQKGVRQNSEHDKVNIEATTKMGSVFLRDK